MKWLRRGWILQTGILQIADTAEDAPRVQSARSAKSSRQQIASEYSAHFPMVASVEPAFNRASHVLNGTLIPAARTRSDGVGQPGAGLLSSPWRGL